MPLPEDKWKLAELQASDLPPHLHRKISVKEVGGAKGIHVRCSVCGHVTAVDDNSSRTEVLRASHTRLEQRAANILQTFFTNCWGWLTYKRRPQSSDPIRSKAIPKVFITGAGRFLRMCYKRSQRTVKGPWFAVAMHGQPGIGEQFFACKLDDLVPVIEGICREAPDLKRQLMNALSGTVDPVHFEAPRKPADDTKLVIDESSAVPIE